MNLPHAVNAYLAALTRRIEDALGGNLHAVILFGSGGLGDFDPAVSDVDVLVSIHTPLDEPGAGALTAAARHESLPCPAAGLDLVVYRREALAQPPRSIPYEYALETGKAWGARQYPRGEESELALDLAAARESGHALFGPPPAEVIGKIPGGWFRDALLSTLRWHATALYDPFHDPLGAQAVLNAARAWHWLEHGALTSKETGGRWAEEQGWPIAGGALRVRHDLALPPLPRPAVEEFLEKVSAALLEADGENHTGFTG